MTVLVGKLGDLFGRKSVFQAAIVFFVIGSVSCGLSQSMAMLVGSRALQGIGGGGITVTASALIGEVVPLRERGRYQGILGAVFGVTTVVGPLLGGYFTDYLTWRWAFWVNVPISVLVIFVAAAAIPALASASKPVIDYGGIMLVGLGAAGLTLATSWGGTLYPWASATIVGLFVGAAAALTGFVWVESRVPQPILPTRLFASPVFTVCCVLSFVVGFAMLGAMTFLPTYMQYVNGVSATTSGLRTLPMVIGMLITSTGSGTLVGKTGRYKVFPVTGTALMAVAFLLMSRMTPSTSALIQSIYLVVLGAGIGLSMQVLVLIVQNTSNFEDLGVATSGVTFFRTIGSSFGAAIFGSLFSNFLDGRMPAALAASGAPPEAVSSPGALHRQPHEVAAPIVAAYSESLSEVLFWAAPVALLGFVLALFLREIPLRDIHNSAVDLGDGFGMPTTDTPERLLENAIARMFRGDPRGSVTQHRDAARLSPRRGRAVGRDAYLPLRADVRDGPAQRYRRLDADPVRGARTHLRAPGRGRLCAARRRPDVADPVRGRAGRLRLFVAAGLDRRQALPVTQLSGPSGPRRSRNRAAAHRPPRSGPTRLARRHPRHRPAGGRRRGPALERVPKIGTSGVPSRHEPNRNVR
ncbi:hypothetical protein MSTO_06990 [Mycobacterium stomatepiae]|uniref:Major facilitator superfamily (MFS) profile domain-containing protein n=1 Tax=Mycobacterium stomatepiae TaxID=470076 RepID=A0A7I7Q292_9MYCO|nr:hypothetical protein MSTO_06990 [Mycobacterium stomatepiae]